MQRNEEDEFEQYAFERNDFGIQTTDNVIFNILLSERRYGHRLSTSLVQTRSAYTDHRQSLDDRFREELGKKGRVIDLSQITESQAIRQPKRQHLPPMRTQSDQCGTVTTKPPLISSSTAVADVAKGGYLSDEGQAKKINTGEFVTASYQMKLDNARRHGLNNTNNNGARTIATAAKKRFVPPTRRSNQRNTSSDEEESVGSLANVYFSNQQQPLTKKLRLNGGNTRRIVPSKKQPAAKEEQEEEVVDERLKNIEPRMIEMIENEILTTGTNVEWDDIAGLNQAKQALHMAVIYPLMRPELFQGIRAPPKGLLLFGPPGTGKTLIAKCIASKAGATFFNISASSLTSKWIGEGEKMVKALFAVARVKQPTVIFIDEIDSLLTQRTDGEQEATRRIKTEFLVQLDGCGTADTDHIVLLGATNRPQELDEAARRRFPKRLYVPLPDRSGRRTIVNNLMDKQRHMLTAEQIESICDQTDGYSGADMNILCREAAFGPISSITNIEAANVDDVRPIAFSDFEKALTQVRPSVSAKDLEIHMEFNRLFGMAELQ